MGLFEGSGPVLENEMKKPVLLIAAAIILTAVLALALFRGTERVSGDDIASLIGVGLMATLMGSFVIAQARGSLTNTLRDLIIWGVIVLVVTLAYVNKAKFGF
jgi:hypothetical protein